MIPAVLGLDQDTVDRMLISRGFPVNARSRELARNASWEEIDAMNPREYVDYGDAPPGDNMYPGGGGPGSYGGIEALNGGAGFMSNDAVSDRVKQLQSLPINGGQGPTMTGPPMLPPGGGFSPAGANPFADALKRLAGQTAQGAINWGTQQIGNWVTSQFGPTNEQPTQGGGRPPVLGGQGGINLPMGGQQGAGGVVYQPGKGLVLRQTYTGTFTRDRRVKFDAMGNIVLRPKRMNVLNPQALSRAYRRVQGFTHVAMASLRHFGFHISRTPSLKKKKSSRFGRR